MSELFHSKNLLRYSLWRPSEPSVFIFLLLLKAPPSPLLNHITEKRTKQPGHEQCLGCNRKGFFPCSLGSLYYLESFRDFIQKTYRIQKQTAWLWNGEHASPSKGWRSALFKHQMRLNSLRSPKLALIPSTARLVSSYSSPSCSPDGG